MKKIVPLVVTILTSFSLMAQPTWSEDIACIVYSHCSNCHNDTGIGPFNLMNYEDAYANRYSMEYDIANKIMPPWPPDQDYAPMAHANVLTDDEIALFQAWVAAGAPEGDPMQAPEPPVIETSEGITDPDLVLTTELFTVPSINSDLYKCFVIPTNWGEDKYISGIEVFPNNRNIVHHVLVYRNLTNDPIIDDQNDPEIGFECGGSIEGGDNDLIGEWVPGSRPWIMPDGTGIKMQDGANIVMQVHYPDGSDGQQDFITLNIKFSDSPNPREVVQDQTLDHIADIQNGPLFILPYETKTFHEKYVLPEARTFLGVAPHAHLICTRMWSFAIKPDGDTVKMVNIPNWDFDWQGLYYYPEPIILPAGTELHGYARYENTADNPNNPNNPPSFVTLGEETEDEMMLFFYSYLYYESGDENIQMGGLSHPHYNNCNEQSVGLNDLERETKFNLYPNPIHADQLYLEINNSIQGEYDLEITDISGKRIWTRTCMNNCEIILPQHINNGMYLARILQNGQTISNTEKIILMR